MWNTMLISCWMMCSCFVLSSSSLAGNKPKVIQTLERVEGTNSYKVGVKDEEMLEVYQKWFETGMSSLLGAIANKKLKKHRKSVISKFGECSSRADDIIKHAKCLKDLMNNKFRRKRPSKKELKRIERYRPYQHDEHDEENGFKQEVLDRKRIKRSTRKTNKYKIKNTKTFLTPMMQVARTLYNSVKAASNKAELPKWQETINNLKLNGMALKKKRNQLEDQSEENLMAMGLQGLRHQTNKDNIEIDEDLEEIQKNPKKLKNLLENLKKKKGNTPEAKVLDIVRSAVEMGYKMAGKDTSNFYNTTMKIGSPKFLELFPDSSNDTINLISPSLFALHESSDPIENLTSIPALMKQFNLDDQQLWLDLIMEAAGVNKQSDDLKEDLRKVSHDQTKEMIKKMEEMVDEHNVPLYATEKNATELGVSQEVFDFWSKVRGSYTKDQLRELNHTGYSILNKHQINTIYGPNSPIYNQTKYNILMNLTESQIHDEIDQQIQLMAEMEDFKIRQQDVVLSPVSFTWVVLSPTATSQPYILSPLMFDPVILSPSVYGAVILTPYIFTPFVLSPRVLGCIILSPWIFSPLILTPIALHPAILSPGVFDPLILSPLALVPFILSPQVFTPIILSPLCMDPVILNPLVGSPLILSPFVLSPTILSPHFLGGLIMSPYALSPVILSPLTAFVALLSPSWLS